MSIFKQTEFKKSIGLSFLLFWYLTSFTQFLIGLSGAASFEGFKDATITAFLWLIPVLIFPKRVKSITGGLGILLWLFALPGFGYFLIYRQELTQSLMFIIFESNQSESVEYIQNYFSIGVALGFLTFTLVPIYIWSKIQVIQTTKKPFYLSSAIIMLLVFLSPVSKAIQQHDIATVYKNFNRHASSAPPWQLGFGYLNYQNELKVVENNLLDFKKIPALTNFKESPKSLPTTVVIVIGESTTRLHMGLYGYPRDTNPKLNSIKNELTIFNNVFASRPNTIESLEQVLTFADQENPDDFKTKPSLIAMMKQAGYKTYWITNQQTLTKRNTMLTTFAKQADEQIFLNNARSQNAYSFDEKVLVPFSEKLNKPDEKKLIIVHLLGTHMKYAYRYPTNYNFFKDGKDLNTKLAEDKLQVINEYDNAVRYNDYIVYELIQRLKNNKQAIQQSLLIYFSDHGEDVYDSKPNNFKGRNEGAPTYPMYAVPFVIWHSANWSNKDRLNDPTIRNRQYDNADFIYTFSDLLGLRYDGYLDYESILSKHFIEDTILVGNPYSKHLSVLNGTVEHKTSHHAMRH